MRLRLKHKQVDPGFGSELLLCQGPSRGREETALKNGVETQKSKDKSSSCDDSVTSDEEYWFL